MVTGNVGRISLGTALNLEGDRGKANFTPVFTHPQEVVLLKKFNYLNIILMKGTHSLVLCAVPCLNRPYRGSVEIYCTGCCLSLGACSEFESEFVWRWGYEQTHPLKVLKGMSFQHPLSIHL